MIHLNILTHFKDTFNQTKQSLDKYNENLQNEYFEIEENENLQKAYKRGEIIFDKCEDDYNNFFNSNVVCIYMRFFNKGLVRYFFLCGTM